MTATNAKTTPQWDVIIVGAGLSGCIAAKQLGEQGLRVLILESGSASPLPPPANDLLSRIKRKLGLSAHKSLPGNWPDQVKVSLAGQGTSSYRTFDIPLGWGLGGGSALYGAALGRFMRHDIELDCSPLARASGDEATLGQALPTHWPVAFEEIKRYYRRAEALLGIVGTPDPLDADDDSNPSTPPPLAQREKMIAADLYANHLHPYRIHVGIQYHPGCTECQGVHCKAGCKADGYSRALSTAMQLENVQLLSSAYLHTIERDTGGYLLHVECAQGELKLCAPRILLAAGALNSPLILQRSTSLWPDARVPTLIGRGLMFHASELFAVFDRSRSSNVGPKKVLAFRDFYRFDGTPYGEIQSVGCAVEVGIISGYLQGVARRMGLGFLGPVLGLLIIPATIAAIFFRPTSIFSTIVEDFPFYGNRVDGSSSAEATTCLPRVVIHYSTAKELVGRCKRLRNMLRKAFAPNHIHFLSQIATTNWGHPMGTCRMGENPGVSVVDSQCQVWGLEGLHIIDASVFPSSAGANPGLTIAANSLRVCDNILSIRKLCATD